MTNLDPEILERWLPGVAIGIGIWLGGWLLGWLLLRPLAHLIHRSSSDVDDLALASVRPQIPVWAAVAGAAIALQQVPVSDPLRAISLRWAGAALILSITLAVARFLGELVRRKSAGIPEALSASTLTQNVVRIAILGLGLLVVAGQLGIAVAPLITALGVGSLAVALALQPTLANFFAGLHITLARRIRVGDFVELENGSQGYVQDIGWRSAQIRELPNNLIIVPNSRLAEIVVKNYSLPETEQAALVQVGVSYGSDLEKVERVTIDVARQTLRETVGGVAEFEPFIRYNAFGDSSINFTVILRVREFVDRYAVTHEFIKALHRRYAGEGIEIPFPQRVVHAAASPQPDEAAR